MAALSVIGANLNKDVFVPKTTKTGATSQGDPNAGASTQPAPPGTAAKITTSDKAGAVILTLLAVVIVIGGASWLVT